MKGRENFSFLCIFCVMALMSCFGYANDLQQPTFGKNVAVYNSNPEDPKARGRKIRVEYPKSWEAKPGVSPNNLYKFTDPSNKGKLQAKSCVITIKDIGGNLLENDWEQLFSDPDFIQEMQEYDPKQMKVLYTKTTKADNLPALMSMYEITLEQLGITLQGKALNVFVGYKNTLINLMCMTAGSNQTMANLLFESSKAEFLLFMNSFKCMDRWENLGKDEDEIKDQQIDTMFKQSMGRDDYQSVANFVAENIELGTLCMNSETDLNKLKNNPDMIPEYSKISRYYIFTHWLKEYCKPYTISDNTISYAQTALTPTKTDAEKKIATIMGNEHIDCLTKEFSSSEYGQDTAYYFLNTMRVELMGLTTKAFCAEFNNNTEIRTFFKGLAQY